MAEFIAEWERVCEALYDAATPPATRRDAERLLIQFSTHSPTHLQQCEILLAQCQTSRGRIAAANAAAKLLELFWTVITLDAKKQFRTIVLNTLAQLVNDPDGINVLSRLLVKITQWAWFDADVFPDIFKDMQTMMSLSEQHELLAIKFYMLLVDEVSRPTPKPRIMTVARARRIAIAFRDGCLKNIFEVSLRQLQKQSTVHAIESLSLFRCCLYFDFIGTNVPTDDSADDLGTIQYPTSWRNYFESNDYPLFSLMSFYYERVSASHQPLIVDCVGQLSAARRSLFTSDTSRSDFLRKAFFFLKTVLSSSDFGTPSSRNLSFEMARAISKLKATYQLVDLIHLSDFLSFLQSLSHFSRHVFQSGSGKSRLALLQFWHRMATSLTYTMDDDDSDDDNDGDPHFHAHHHHQHSHGESPFGNQHPSPHRQHRSLMNELRPLLHHVALMYLDVWHAKITNAKVDALNSQSLLTAFFSQEGEDGEEDFGSDEEDISVLHMNTMNELEMLVPCLKLDYESTAQFLMRQCVDSADGIADVHPGHQHQNDLHRQNRREVSLLQMTMVVTAILMHSNDKNEQEEKMDATLINVLISYIDGLTRRFSVPSSIHSLISKEARTLLQRGQQDEQIQLVSPPSSSTGMGHRCLETIRHLVLSMLMVAMKRVYFMDTSHKTHYGKSTFFQLCHVAHVVSSATDVVQPQTVHRQMDDTNGHEHAGVVIDKSSLLVQLFFCCAIQEAIVGKSSSGMQEVIHEYATGYTTSRILKSSPIMSVLSLYHLYLFSNEKRLLKLYGSLQLLFQQQDIDEKAFSSLVYPLIQRMTAHLATSTNASPPQSVLAGDLARLRGIAAEADRKRFKWLVRGFDGVWKEWAGGFQAILARSQEDRVSQKLVSGLLAWIRELVQNKGHRVVTCSATSLVLTREATHILQWVLMALDYLAKKAIEMVRGSKEMAGGSTTVAAVCFEGFFGKLLKRVLQVLKWMMGGDYVAFQVLVYYQDMTLFAVMAKVFRLLLDVGKGQPLHQLLVDMAQLTELNRAYYSFVSYVVRDHMGKKMLKQWLDDETLMLVMYNACFGLDSLDLQVTTDMCTILEMLGEKMCKYQNQMHPLVAFVQQHPATTKYILQCLLHHVLEHENTSIASVWSLTRPLYPFVTLMPDAFAALQLQFIQQQPIEKHLALNQAFQHISVENLFSKENKDKFTSDMNAFLRDLEKLEPIHRGVLAPKEHPFHI